MLLPLVRPWEFIHEQVVMRKHQSCANGTALPRYLDSRGPMRDLKIKPEFQGGRSTA